MLKYDGESNDGVSKMTLNCKNFLTSEETEKNKITSFEESETHNKKLDLELVPRTSSLKVFFKDNLIDNINKDNVLGTSLQSCSELKKVKKKNKLTTF